MRKDLLIALPSLLTGLLLAGLFQNHLNGLRNTLHEAEELSTQLSSDLRLLSLYQENCAGLDRASRHKHDSYVSVRELMASNIDRLRHRLREIARFPGYAEFFVAAYRPGTLRLEFEKADSFAAWLTRTGLDFSRCEVREGS